MNSLKTCDITTRQILGFYPQIKKKKGEQETREARQNLFKNVTIFLKTSGRFPEDIPAD